jgi:hypothetical protein
VAQRQLVTKLPDWPEHIQGNLMNYAISAEDKAQQRVLDASKRLHSFLEGLPEGIRDALVAHVAGHYYVLVKTGNAWELWFAPHSETFGLDVANLRTLQSLNDVIDWHLSAEDLNEIAEQMEEWALRPQFVQLTGEDAARVKTEVADTTHSYGRKLLAEALLARPEARIFLLGTVEQIQRTLLDYHNNLNEKELAPTGDDYNELHDQVKHDLDNLLKLLGSETLHS